MLKDWLCTNLRNPCHFKFSVEDITERLNPDISNPDDIILNSMAEQLLIACAPPDMIREEIEMLLEDVDELDLHIIKDYVETEIIFPTKGVGKEEIIKLITWIGNFGEVLAAQYLIESEGFWFPIYKLRFREKKDYAMKLTDICLVKTEGLQKPLVCYGEVKTKTSSCDKDLGIKGHESLKKDDALEKPEILRFLRQQLYSMQRYDEARFFSGISLGKISYDIKHTLILVHETKSWEEDILKNLHSQELDSRLVNFSVKVILIQELRQVIDETYARAWQNVGALLS